MIIKPASFPTIRLPIALGFFALIHGLANPLAAAPPEEASPETAEQIAFFESKVRPILVEHCYECHATDSESIEAGLLLDSKWGWETGGDSGPALIPHAPEDSLLIEAVKYEENIISGMPPQSKLAAEKIEILEQWIEMGAPDPREKVSGEGNSTKEKFNLQERYKEHWSWRSIENPQPPEVKKSQWPRNPMDRFVLAAQEERGLLPAQEAKRETWIRRVYFDLIGLPPSSEQIQAFVNDESPNAYEKVVNSLLKSTFFGEKWARHWLDLMRYAESYGHEFDYGLPHATEYRDYVIRALNEDVPYSQFLREHLAGDLIANPRLNKELSFNESVIGTGFWYLHEATHAPTDVLGNEADIMDNQIDVFGKAFLGLTVACARCHDHKFDAISTQDYYALTAHIHSSARQEVNLDINEQRKTARKLIGAELNKVNSTLAESAKGSPEFQTKLSSNLASTSLPIQLQSLDADDTTESDVIRFENFDTDVLPQGWSVTDGAFEPIGNRAIARFDGSLAMPGTVDSGYWGNKQVGALRSPTFTIEKNNIHLLVKSTANIKIQIVIDNYQMTGYNGLLFGGTLLKGNATDTQGKWAWKTIGGTLRKYVGHRAYLEIVDSNDGEISIDQILFSNSGAPAINEGEALDETGFKEQLTQAAGDLKEGIGNRWLSWQSSTNPNLTQVVVPELKAYFESAKTANDKLSNARFALAMAQGTVEDAAVYIRGSHTNPGTTVPPRNLTALGGMTGSRLDLANHLIDPSNPLTSRVIVNRIWHHLFGTGIVPTVDDFGPQGQPASNLALLDWLATDHINANWSIKHTIRTIVLSATYRQQSVPNPSLKSDKIATVDPINETLHFMPIRRLTGESIRDAIMMVSGSLNESHYGGSVPTHRTEFMTGRGARGSGPLDGNGRRSIYLSVYRNFLNPFVAPFDTPNPFGPQGRRSKSTVPAHALHRMHDPLVLELSKRLGKKLTTDQKDLAAERIRSMVIAAHGQEPNEDQLRDFEAFLDHQATVHGRLDERAWSDLAHTLFNMKAFYFLR